MKTRSPPKYRAALQELISDAMVSPGASRRLLSTIAFRGVYVLTEKKGEVTEYTDAPGGSRARRQIKLIRRRRAGIVGKCIM